MVGVGESTFEENEEGGGAKVVGCLSKVVQGQNDDCWKGVCRRR